MKIGEKTNVASTEPPGGASGSGIWKDDPWSNTRHDAERNREDQEQREISPPLNRAPVGRLPTVATFRNRGARAATVSCSAAVVMTDTKTRAPRTPIQMFKTARRR